MSEQATLGGYTSNAEILLWQEKFRRSFAALIGCTALSLKASGLIRADSILVPSIGLRASLGIATTALVAYLVFTTLVGRRMSRTGLASDTTLHTVLVVDFVLIFTMLVAVTPPAEYSRGLLFAIFVVQSTRIYFGLRATVVSVICAAVGHVLVTVAAMQAGVLESPAEQFWNLAIFLVGAALLGGLHGQVSGRVSRVLQLFERAQEGDFTGTYDESLDRLPDSITIIGRSYNTMRGRLQSILLTDPLSGCFNRRGFDQICAREASRGVRARHSMAVLAIDVDHFKRINDEFGHLTGDEVLREMGQRLRDSVRAGDVVARTGGEEFEILAPDTSVPGAESLAERIQAAFREKPFVSLGGVRVVGVSIGIACVEATNDQVISTLIARADEALYVAKQNGRDCSQFWKPGLRAFDSAAPVQPS